MHDLFGGLVHKAMSNKGVWNNLFHDVASPGFGAAVYGRSAAKGGVALTAANIKLSQEFLQTSAMKNARNWMIGGAAYGGITGANNGRRNGQGTLRGGIGGALRGGAMGFGGARGYAMFGHKIPSGFKNTANSWKPFGR
jgi:hypothetical protein